MKEYSFFNAPLTDRKNKTILPRDSFDNRRESCIGVENMLRAVAGRKVKPHQIKDLETRLK